LEIISSFLISKASNGTWILGNENSTGNSVDMGVAIGWVPSFMVLRIFSDAWGMGIITSWVFSRKLEIEMKGGNY
jgi:hypothetical protein